MTRSPWTLNAITAIKTVFYAINLLNLLSRR